MPNPDDSKSSRDSIPPFPKDPGTQDLSVPEEFKQLSAQPEGEFGPPHKYLRTPIRHVTQRDMPEVLVIEHASFDFPRCEEEFLRVLRQKRGTCMVALAGEKVAGFMIYELHKNEIVIFDLAVHPEYRRLGVGSQLVNKLIGMLNTHRRTRLNFLIRESNLPAQLFLKYMGLRAVEVRREHFQDTGEDAYHMMYVLDDREHGQSGPRL